MRKVWYMALAVALIAALVGGATMAWFTDSATSEPVSFAAGTVLVDASTTMFYGLEYKEGQRGTLYEIFVNKTNNEISHIKLFDSNRSSLNALAYDRKNKRLYYADRQGRLYFYSFTTGTGDHAAGQLFEANTPLYNATFGMGYYWFVKEQTDDLYKVSFKSDGTIDEVILVKENFTNDPNKRFGFADLAMDMKDGIIYGSTSGLSSSTREFFSFNVYTGEYTEIKQANGDAAINLQLAFGADGMLYGQLTRQESWYIVDPVTGTQTFFFKDDVQFSDLACNYQANWNPGDCDLLRYYVQNEGTKNNYVRVSVSGTWNFEDAANVVSLELFDNMDDWVKIGDYFYYTKVLAPGEDVLLGVRVCLNGPATGNEFQGATFTVSADVDAIQASNDAINDPQNGWGWAPPAE